MISALSVVQKTLPEIVEAGSFGPCRKYESFLTDNKNTGQDQYATTVVFGKLVLSDGEKYQLVIKFKHPYAILRECLHSDNQFHNEITMYKQIIPFFNSMSITNSQIENPLFARFFYGNNVGGENFEKDMIVLENVSTLGYKLSEQRLMLDYEHIEIALKSMAKFHGFSYTAKHKNNQQFLELTKKTQESQWFESGEWVIRKNGMKVIGKTDINRLVEKNPDKYKNNLHVQKLLEHFNEPDNNLRKLMNNYGSVPVLCHGDFCRNNILFKYNNLNHPIAALIFDFANIRYGSPALDLSFFLYLNTDRKLRTEYWYQLLDVYCKELAVSVPEGVVVPDRKAIEVELAKYSIYGLSHVSFFLRVMSEENFQLDITKLDQVSMDQWVKELLALGGEKGADLVVDVYEHIIEKGYTNML
ncbi:uncharacterized protein LOC126900720 [Daktulosphaira vitifoliae]|uniref:uncharacterized protein LOC126900720 n=1 Tax=Daktulosphaira vitifoliae TaxID=58002 RepID=UPI0021AA9D05|nr:uncharacterized protein LOC126900720 [Daktulosphaira vitifoliae]